MWQLIAQGPETRQRWKHRIEPKRRYNVGRDVSCDLPVPWESQLSKEHFEIEAVESGVRIRGVAKARNPIFWEGEIQLDFILKPSQRCVVGKTSFFVRESDVTNTSADSPIQEISFSHQDLERVHFEDADRRLEALARLPEAIGHSVSREESFEALVGLILAGIRHADAAAIVACDANGEVSVIAWERRHEVAGTFRPSFRLVGESLHEQRSILHVWESAQLENENYTVHAEFDWAFCTPVHRVEDESWGIYVAGQFDQMPTDATPLRSSLQSDVRFAQLVGEIISSANRMNQMEGQLSVLRQFLSPPILAALEGTGDRDRLNIELLKPKVCDVTVLFCDLRGFSQRAEEAADDLPALLRRVSAALEVMSGEILNHGGITGDFLGDAVLGFWGWPFGSEDAPLKACRAALSIRQKFAEFHNSQDHELKDFRVGVGVAHGRAIAGKVETVGRLSVTVFGPIVNLASRLESMTKKLQVPILLDEPTSKLARSGLMQDEGRVRRLAKVQPYGMDTPLVVSELVPPYGSFSELTDEQLTTYEQGVDAFISGDWEKAYQSLHAVPASDRAQDFLLALITQHNRTPPVNWQGVIELPSK